MKLLDALKRPTLSLVPAPVAPAPAARFHRQLKKEIADLAAAHQAAAAARETLKRMQAVEQTKVVASQKAAADARAVSEYRERWVRDGCRDSDGPALKALEDKSAESTRAAESAAANWDAVQEELERTERILRDRESSIPGCQREIEAAAWAIVIEERKQTFFDRYARCAEELRLLEREAWAVLRHVRPERYGGQASRNQFRIEGAISNAYIKPFDGSYFPDLDRNKELLDSLAAPWLERYRELLEDPNS